MGDVAGTGDNSLSSSCLKATDLTASFARVQSITASVGLSGSYIYGDGRHLVNVARAQGSRHGDLQYYFSDDGRISGSSNLRYVTGSNTLSIVGEVSASTNISASYFYGDGT